MMVLAFIIETAVVRQYAFAAIFITPMTILQTAGGDSTTGEFTAPAADAQGPVFSPLLPPVMPPKDAQQ